MNFGLVEIFKCTCNKRRVSLLRFLHCADVSVFVVVGVCV